jgi:hypothetical protein
MIIKVKFGKCPDCTNDREKTLIAGRCLYHYKKKRAEINKIKRKKDRMPIILPSTTDEIEIIKPKVYLKKNSPVLQSDIQKWFNFFMVNAKRKCENCGFSLKHYSDNDWYGSQNHILEKSLFPSVAANLHNHMVLGKWCCHSQWHTSWHNAQKMECFPLAIIRVNRLISLLTPEELRKLPECFQNKNPHLSKDRGITQ